MTAKFQYPANNYMLGPYRSYTGSRAGPVPFWPRGWKWPRAGCLYAGSMRVLCRLSLCGLRGASYRLSVCRLRGDSCRLSVQVTWWLVKAIRMRFVAILLLTYIIDQIKYIVIKLHKACTRPIQLFQSSQVCCVPVTIFFSTVTGLHKTCTGIRSLHCLH